MKNVQAKICSVLLYNIPQGPLVYVNYARIEDFVYLKNQSFELNGTIAIARYGKIFRGDKVIVITKLSSE